MTDFTDALGLVDREVVRGEEQVMVRMRRTYDASAEDVWGALTEPERLSRWFLPVSGDLREGGKYALEGNASGEIVRCEPPRFLKVTWMSEVSVLVLRLEDAEQGTEFTLEHSVPLEMAGSGAGSLFVGPGWDVALLSLGLYLSGEPVEDPQGWENSLDVQRYSALVIEAWAEAASASATPEEIEAGKAAARAQFTPDL